ncbi:unnamed protein product [Didymodactylos carnosus]|uniref:Uncharacterized protein n=1 Tax=Didymodactylos carnosus TaxID=1234261 RepID=A0A814PCN0_9BILA|nr:unnamed protein product [Didymodactylos carnosus]CAF1104335.1 unnamed protein product [Didymodactylos carnosus]CAF3671722.1 unnamed protein product [Didymodactylos carnosus]CAF3869047.1 unnamed protein product [Didymodactylos carnosus]
MMAGRLSRVSEYSVSEMAPVSTDIINQNLLKTEQQQQPMTTTVQIHLLPEPKRHPLRRESFLNISGGSGDPNSMWPFKIDFNFLRQTSQNSDRSNIYSH